MEAGTTHATARGINNRDARGAWLRGDAPRELVLSDGTSLVLESHDEGGVGWRRHDGLEGRTRGLSADEAQELAGEWAGYVQVRTRAESEWLRTVAEWCDAEAERLEDELGRCRR
jgi:hypothetical protein